MTQESSTKLITVIGGAGFLGRYVVRDLAETGARVRVGVRNPNAALYLKPMGTVGQIQLCQTNIRNADSIRIAVEGADAVINLVGIMGNSGRNTMSAVHENGAEQLAEICTEMGVNRLVHVSALGADLKSRSSYLRSRAEGERRLSAAYPDATIIRPSVLFGPEDDFFNRFATLARALPFLPLIGGGHTQFQPAYVADVARAIVKALEDASAPGRIYELGGPATWSLKQVYEFILSETDRNNLLVPMPFFAATFAAFFLQLLPGKILTPDQVTMLKTDNVVSEDAQGFADLGINPTPVDIIMTEALERHRKV